MTTVRRVGYRRTYLVLGCSIDEEVTHQMMVGEYEVEIHLGVHPRMDLILNPEIVTEIAPSEHSAPASVAVGRLPSVFNRPNLILEISTWQRVSCENAYLSSADDKSQLL